MKGTFMLTGHLKIGSMMSSGLSNHSDQSKSSRCRLGYWSHLQAANDHWESYITKNVNLSLSTLWSFQIWKVIKNNRYIMVHQATYQYK